ncbi:MAG: 3'-phosphoesterase [Acidobacteria bacterium]|nr:3'-phosphoesterase [Acidobacteriota bacterium]
MAELKFVVHEHKASRHHYDFRLEVEGVLRSWAVPKGPSMNPSDKRLAVMVPDHPLEYGDYEGIIPEGNYGAGPVVIWDAGTYQPEEDDPAQALGKGKLSFVLRGKKLKGAFALARFKGPEGKEWLLMKKRDAHADAWWKLKSELTAKRIQQLREKKPPCDSA